MKIETLKKWFCQYLPSFLLLRKSNNEHLVFFNITISGGIRGITVLTQNLMVNVQQITHYIQQIDRHTTDIQQLDRRITRTPKHKFYW
jgi:hypothetical protein